MPSLGSRGAQVQHEQFSKHPSFPLLFEFKFKSNEPKTICQFRSSHEFARLHDDYNSCSWDVIALPYQHWILSQDLSMKQLGILGTEMIFTLPRCLLLGVMCPLHLHELDGLVASLAP